jgi:Alkylmercury lyase
VGRPYPPAVDLEVLRLAVYAHFRKSGLAPSSGELAAVVGTPEDDIRSGLAQLAAQRHLVLGPDGAIVMAHPFSAVPLGFSVMGRRTLWWGGCAWDSFALAHLLPEEGALLVATRCPGCGQAHAWSVGPEQPPIGDQVGHFLVPVAHMWDDVVHTCRNQRIFCSEECVSGWLVETDHERGYLMDLGTLWRLASHWYEGRLNPGYVRREPSQAQQYLRSVGLSGPFWGL